MNLIEGEDLTQRTTNEIRELLRNANFDFASVENDALNAYLPRIFHICPFSEDVCIKKQCVGCSIFEKTAKK